METLLLAFEPYRHVDPPGWVGIYRSAPVPVGVIAALLGVVLLFRGRGTLFRLVAGPLGAVLGATWTQPLLARFGATGNAAQLTSASTVALALLGFAYPPAVMFFAFGIPAGLLTGQLAGPNDWLIGFGPGFLVGGALGVVFYNSVSSVLAAGFGAWLVVEGLMAALAPFTSAVGFFAGNPIPTLSLMGCLALAGGSYQLFVLRSPEEAETLRSERALKKKHEDERKALEQRWTAKSAKK